ncbi:RimK family alpha-L-glutamate ligase [Rhodoferax sp.]|uniref:ATP-grasp domain-containing protein n=1 Tax=Rhodoferax sp. TaxID=50421 RepID=UPI00374D26A6
MILVYGQRNDPPIDCLVAALQAAGARYQLLDMADLDSAMLRVQVGPHGVTGDLLLDGECTELDDIRAVYARPLTLALDDTHEATSQHALALHQRLVEWLDIASALVVSRPAAVQASASKPRQAQLIGQSGFAVPAMLVTSDEDEAQAFRRLHGRVVFKSISGRRSSVAEMDDSWLSRMQRLAPVPSQFQAHVPGVDVRVHVVGRQVFAAEVGDAAGRTLTATRLPPAVAAQCVAMSAAMDLPVAGIDLRLRPDGEYVCCDVNPLPAYSDFEAECGLPMAATLAQLLLAAA